MDIVKPAQNYRTLCARYGEEMSSMPDASRIRRRVLISGHVQGVGFRASCQQQAIAHSVDGWVENRPDGTVFAVFAGNEDDVASLIEWCHRGPEFARVRAVYVEDVSALDDLPRFEIR